MKRISGLVAIAIMFLSLTVSAQNNQRCLTQISGLTEDQKTQIADLNKEHQSQMAQLRNERQSTTDIATKNSIREKMNLAKAQHKASVLKLLNDGQKVQYLAMNGQKQMKNGNGQNPKGTKAKGNGNGQGKKGQGNCQGKKGNQQGGKGKGRTNS